MRIHLKVAAVTLLGVGMTSASASAKDVTVKVDAATSHQTLQGFGATHQTLAYGAADYLGPFRAKAIEAAYGQVGLNTGNVGSFISTPPNRPQFEAPGYGLASANDNDDPFVINPAGFTWTDSDNAKSKLIDLAKPFGFTDFYPAFQINIKYESASTWLGPLRTSNFDRYLDECAEHVLAGLLHWRDSYGITQSYVQLFNEPLSGNSEMQPATADELAQIVKRVGQRLAANGFPGVKFAVPGDETPQTSLDEATIILADPEARKYVGAIAYHTYPYGSPYSGILNILNASGKGTPDADSVAVRAKLRDLGARYGLPLWMTEVSTGGVDALSYDSFRGRAIHIHDEFVYTDAAAYFGMLGMWDSRSNTEHGLPPIRNGEGNIVIIDLDTSSVDITGMGRAIGHYARFLKRGSIRLEATTDEPLVQATAFRDAKSGRLVVVAINNSATAQTLRVEVSGSKISGSVSGEASTEAAYWVPIAPFAPTTASSFAITVPALGVQTLAVTLGAGTPPDAGVPANVDAGTDAAGGSQGASPAADTSPMRTGGCGCRLGHSSEGASMGLLVVLLGLGRRLGPRRRCLSAARRS